MTTDATDDDRAFTSALFSHQGEPDQPAPTANPDSVAPDDAHEFVHNLFSN
jgi:hypothetical protein